LQEAHTNHHWEAGILIILASRSKIKEENHMELKKDFTQELNQANGNGTPEARYAFLNTARAAARELSATSVMEKFDGILEKYGRAAVAVCVAVTIDRRRNRVEPRTVQWAVAVLSIWQGRPSVYSGLYINDQLHPSKVEQYAGDFIRSTIASD